MTSFDTLLKTGRRCGTTSLGHSATQVPPSPRIHGTASTLRVSCAASTCCISARPPHSPERYSGLAEGFAARYERIEEGLTAYLTRAVFRIAVCMRLCMCRIAGIGLPFRFMGFKAEEREEASRDEPTRGRLRW